jgi:hypothetical protein
MIAQVETARARGEFRAAFETAIVYAGLGDSTKVYAWLHNALTEHDWQLIHLSSHPAFAPYRGSPTFQSIVRRVGMTAPAP